MSNMNLTFPCTMEETFFPDIRIHARAAGSSEIFKNGVLDTVLEV